jgi:ubiquinol-cytochrome c reductase iron-sulfur subunit
VTTPRRGHERLPVVAFLLASAASIALVVVFATGGDAQLEGALLAVALGGIGIGLASWSHELTGNDVEIEARPPIESAAQPREEFMVTLEGSSRPLSRRRVLIGSASAAGASLVAALLLPARSLGPSPGRALFRTPWRSGRRLVTPDGTALRAAELELGNIVTVFPEGAVDADDAATLLIRVEADRLELPPDRLAGAPDGLVAYSKICTHVGCPVGLYRENTHELVCPCHQSTFDVLHGAQPTFGPATRALPQLPIGVDDDGYLIALGDYPEPVGPGFWNRGT